MSTIFKEDKLIFVAGDFNLEMLKENKTGSEFLANMNSFDLSPSINVNTRITPNSASCIDNIFTNSVITDSCVIENFVSDHTAQKVLYEMETSNVPNFEHKRIFSQEKINNFFGQFEK